MSSRIARATAGKDDQSQNMLLAPEGFGTIASEWQDFVGRRLKEDFALMQRLTQSCAPDQLLAAYSDFWQKAAEDYGKEITTMSKLMTGVATRMVSAAQSPTAGVGTNMFPSREAAQAELGP